MTSSKESSTLFERVSAHQTHFIQSMAVSLTILVVFIISIILSAVNSPSTDRDFKSTKNVSVPTEMVNESIIINLLRKRRETTRGHGCPIGKIFYFTGCRTLKE